MLLRSFCKILQYPDFFLDVVRIVGIGDDLQEITLLLGGALIIMLARQYVSQKEVYLRASCSVSRD